MSMTSRSVLSLGLSKETLFSLTRCGYETVQDLLTTSEETLAKELNITQDAAQNILARARNPASQNSSNFPLTQSAAALSKSTDKFSARCEAIDKLLEGGLRRGHMLEISGPPGSPKEAIALNLVTSFVEAKECVIFVDCQNMTSAATLQMALQQCPDLPSNYEQLISYTTVHSLSELMIFLHRLPSLLESQSKASLLVLNSVSFPFQYPIMSLSFKNSLLERVKQALTKVSIAKNLTVVTTSQLSTKMFNPDGSPGSFDTGGRGFMVPQLAPMYLPMGRTYRIILSPDSPNSGVAKLLSSPTSPPGRSSQVPLKEPYSVVHTVSGRITMAS